VAVKANHLFKYTAHILPRLNMYTPKGIRSQYFVQFRKYDILFDLFEDNFLQSGYICFVCYLFTFILHSDVHYLF